VLIGQYTAVCKTTVKAFRVVLSVLKAQTHNIIPAMGIITSNMITTLHFVAFNCTLDNFIDFIKVWSMVHDKIS
jgi:hypothetical protein